MICLKAVEKLAVNELAVEKLAVDKFVANKLPVDKFADKFHGKLRLLSAETGAN